MLARICRTLLAISRTPALAIAATALCATDVASQDSLRLPWVFSDHMVLQSGRPAPVWGHAAPGERLEVEFAELRLVATADDAGRWRVDLPPRAPDAVGRPLTVTGERSALTFTDVVVGEVWLCAGQSNMDFPLERAALGLRARKEADLPLVRLCDRTGSVGEERKRFSPADLERIAEGRYFEGRWEVCTPRTARSFSAVGFFFGRELVQLLDVPIGLIDVSVGGSSTEGWVPTDLLRDDRELAPLAENFLTTHLSHPFIRERTIHHLRDWERAGSPAPRPRHFFQPGFLYEEAIATLAPFTLRGVLWYQGESNAHLPRVADRLFRMLVPAWRRAWGVPGLPFLVVQLPGMDRPTWPEFREVQDGWRDIPGVHVAVTIDVGERDDVHPRAKLAVGQRLARLALAHSYQRRIAFTGPRLRSATPEGSRLVLTFDDEHPIAFEVTRGPVGFELAGADRRFHPARATIEGQRVVLSSPLVPFPLWAHYAWAPFPDWSLVNKHGLPAAPFRTEDWRPVRVACIGDSITAGFGLEDSARESYPARLQELLGDGFDVRNFGHSGACVVRSTLRDDASDRAYVRQPEHHDALLFAPQVVICNLGINDVMEWATKGEEFVPDYLALLDEYRRLPSAPRILLWGPLSPLFPGQTFHDRAFGDGTVEAAIHAAIAEVAQRAALSTIDLYTPLAAHAAWYPDHLHPNAAGAAAIAEVVREALTHIELPFAPPPVR